MNDFIQTLTNGVQCKCPRCLKGNLYASRFNLNIQDKCPECGLDLSKNDSADGPAVFLIFILGFLIVPLALLVDTWLSPPFIVHAVLWSVVLVALTIGTLKPLKSYIIYLQYKYRPDMLEDKE
ncbi:MAG: DUF983 domain-containing protein [Pseudomonadota bacterium]